MYTKFLFLIAINFLVLSEQLFGMREIAYSCCPNDFKQIKKIVPLLEELNNYCTGNYTDYLCSHENAQQAQDQNKNITIDALLFKRMFLQAYAQEGSNKAPIEELKYKIVYNIINATASPSTLSISPRDLLQIIAHLKWGGSHVQTNPPLFPLIIKDTRIDVCFNPCIHQCKKVWCYIPEKNRKTLENTVIETMNAFEEIRLLPSLKDLSATALAKKYGTKENCLTLKGKMPLEVLEFVLSKL